MQEFILEQSQKPSFPKEIIYTNIFTGFTTILFFLFWISEVYWGRGILRPGYLGESCPCALGLDCREGICEKEWYVIYENYTCPEIICPVYNPVIEKKVSYFEYNEFVNGFLLPATENFIEYIPYAACKELCSQKQDCTSICYSDNKCFLKTNHILPPLYNENTTMWTCSVRIN